MNLTKDAKHWYKLWSVWAAIAVMAVSILELTLPSWQTLLSDRSYAILVVGVTAAGQILRFIKQKKLENDAL